MATPEITATEKTPVVPEFSPEITRNIIGKMGTPFVINDFKITIKNVALGSIQTSVWIEVTNTADVEKLFKLSPNPVMIDNQGNQVETIILERSGISQSNLYPKAMREGAIFFEPLKDGRSPKKLVLEMNGQKAEITLEK
jgi:hypothetical protein